MNKNGVFLRFSEQSPVTRTVEAIVGNDMRLELRKLDCILQS